MIINRTSRGGGMFVGMTMFYNVNLYGNGQYNQGLYCVQNYDNTKLCFMGLFLHLPMMRKYCASVSLGAKMKELNKKFIMRVDRKGKATIKEVD